MKKEELTNIINLISERDWTPLYEEGCERAGHNRVTIRPVHNTLNNTTFCIV